MEKNMIKNSLSLKLFIVGFLIAILMIPTGMIAVLVNDREDRQKEAFYEVSEKWGREQTITGPILTVPYKKNYETNAGDNNTSGEIVKYAHFLPEKLIIDGSIEPETRQRGIYEIAVYNSDLDLKGEFLFPDFSAWEIASENIMYDKAFVSLGIPDMRGIKENIKISWSGQDLAFKPGIETSDVLSSGASTNVAIDRENKEKKYDFSLSLSLNGSRDLYFTPVGKETEVALRSPWLDPSFQGAFLPESHEINDSGFNAYWKVLELNRNFPQSFLGSLTMDSPAPIVTERYDKMESQLNKTSFVNSNFGVRLIIPADEYQKTVRALKYAIMMLSLTFLTLFFFEALYKKRVHPLQYILIGLSLSLFYVLLLAFAEHVGFYYSYLISVSATVIMISLYSKSIFREWKPVAIESSILVFIYGFIFVILQLEDFALLVGAIGLFVILSVVMYVSRKIDWYNINS